jgi:hypothetical protein
MTINNYMSVQINYVDTFQTRYAQSFVNLTKIDSTTYPANTSISIGYNDTTSGPAVTAYNVYDQWALRVVTDGGLPAY